MNKPAVVQGTFADFKNIKTRSVIQLIIEVPIEQGQQVLEALGYPQPGKEVNVAVARLIQPQAITARTSSPVSADDLTRRAAIMCNQKAFWEYSKTDSVEAAAAYVRKFCGVASRRDICIGLPSGQRFKRLVQEYEAFLRASGQGMEPVYA